MADRGHVAYEVADLSHADNVMTVRDKVDGPRRVVPRDTWRFARLEAGKVVADSTHVYLEGGFEPHRLYDIVYQAQNPTVVGLGPAAVRDTMSWLKYGNPEVLSIPAGSITKAVAYGASQSGRFLRTFLYYGFNADESNRKSLDGIMSHIAAGGRGSFNHRFAQPSRDGHPYLNKLYPTDIFPFSDVVQHDPETDMQDGLLAGVKPAFMPKVFYTNSSYEYWGRTASLVHTTIDGKSDLPLMDNVRAYSFAGGQHGPGRVPPVYTSGQQLANPNDYTWVLRSLLLAMDRWIDTGTAPPPSRYPRIADGESGLARGSGVSGAAGRRPTGRSAQGVSRCVRPRVPQQGCRDGRTSRSAVGLPDSGAAGRHRRQRARRSQDAGGGRAARDLHRVESVQGGSWTVRRAREHAGLICPVPADQGRNRWTVMIRGRRSRNDTGAARTISTRCRLLHRRWSVRGISWLTTCHRSLPRLDGTGTI